MNTRKHVDDEEQALVGAAKACFDESVERLDAETLSRLNRARRAALAARGGRSLPAWRGLLPATGVAAAVAMAALLLLRAPDPATMPVTLPVDNSVDNPADVADLLFGEDNLEMLEDLEFYIWMDEVDGGRARGMG